MNDLTTGSIPRNILRMAALMLVSMVLQTMYFVLDLYFVGRLGSTSVAAVSLAGNVSFAVIAATQVLGVGTTAVIAQAVGRKDRDGALRVFNQSMLLSLLASAMFGAIMLATRSRYSALLSADAETARASDAYLTWFVPALALQFPLVSAAAALRATGNFKPGMWIQSASLLINMVLAPALLFGWVTGRPLGVAGPAVASFIAILFANGAIVAYIVRWSDYLRFVREHWRAQVDVWWRILRIGLPAGAELALLSAYLVIVYFIARPFGNAAQAGIGIGMRVTQALFLPVVALAFAVSPVAGQNFGARQPDRVREAFRTGALMAAAVTTVMMIVCVFAPDPLVRVFSSAPGVRAFGDEYMRLNALGFVAYGINYVAASVFQAIGNAMPIFFTAILRLIVGTVPAYWISTTAGFQLRWVWFLSVAAVTLQLIVNLTLLRRELRRIAPP